MVEVDAPGGGRPDAWERAWTAAGPGGSVVASFDGPDECGVGRFSSEWVPAEALDFETALRAAEALERFETACALAAHGPLGALWIPALVAGPSPLPAVLGGCNIARGPRAGARL